MQLNLTNHCQSSRSVRVCTCVCCVCIAMRLNLQPAYGSLFFFFPLCVIVYIQCKSRAAVNLTLIAGITAVMRGFDGEPQAARSPTSHQRPPQIKKLSVILPSRRQLSLRRARSLKSRRETAAADFSSLNGPSNAVMRYFSFRFAAILDPL